MSYKASVFNFLKLEKGPHWQSKSNTNNHCISRDSQRCKVEPEVILFGAYYFMGNTKTYHTRDYFDFVGLVSKTGGIFATLYALFSVPGKYINTQSFMSTLMKEMQFISLKDTDDDVKDPKISKRTNLLYDVKYTWSDKFTLVKMNVYHALIRVCCCFKISAKPREYLKPSEYFFYRGFEKLERDLSNVRLLKTIKTLKAAVQMLIKVHYGDDPSFNVDF